MYIPAWLIVIGLIIVYWLYKNSNKDGSVGKVDSLEDIEAKVVFLKDEIFQLEHFDSPHFIDAQNDFDIMEINYLRLKERYVHTPEKLVEIAQDWLRYIGTLRELKQARVMLDVDFSDNAYENFSENSKQPTIIQEEIEKKFKALLGKDWQKLLPDYFEREDNAKPKVKKLTERLGVHNAWSVLYAGESNLERMENMRKFEENEKKNNKTI